MVAPNNGGINAPSLSSLESSAGLGYIYANVGGQMVVVGSAVYESFNTSDVALDNVDTTQSLRGFNKDMTTVALGWHAVETVGTVVVGVGLMAGSVVTTLGICGETAGLGCAVAAASILPSYFMGGWYITKSAWQELNEP